MKRKEPERWDVPVLEAGEGRCRIQARILPMGDHLLVAVTGGEAHIGAAALAEPYTSRKGPGNTGVSLSVLTRTTHKEDAIAREMAFGLASAGKVPVLVCCGIHVDDITPVEVEEINRNADTLLEKITAALNSRP